MDESRKYGIMKLGDDNYHVWRQRTELWLRREDLWDVIGEDTPTTPDSAWLKRDRQARATIGLLIEDKFLSDIKHERTAQSAWNKLRQTHSHNSLGSRLLLYRKIFSSRFTPGSSMIDHITGILEAASRLEDAGFKMLDELVCSALLGSLPTEYDVLITTIEGRNTDEITIDYVREKILEEFKKKHKSHSQPSHDTRALLTSSRTPRKTQPKQVKCYYCQKVGHIRKDCRLLKNHNAHSDYTRRTDYKKHDQSKLVTYVQSPSSKQYETNQEHTPVTSTFRALNTKVDLQPSSTKTWVIDTGAADHMCSDITKLHNVVNTTAPITVVTASGEKHQVTQKGDFKLRLTDTTHQPQEILLTQVLHVPSLTDNLLSIARMDDDQYVIHFRNRESWLEREGIQMKLGELTNKLYIHVEQSETTNDKAYACQHIWHSRLAHRNDHDVERMTKESMVEDLVIKPCRAKGLCAPCNIAKMANLPFPKDIAPRSTKPFQVLHTDLCGPISPASLGNNSYILSILDDFTKYATIYIVKTKDQTTSKIREFVEQGMNKFNRRPEVLFSDGGGEYGSRTLSDYLCERGIKHLTSLPYTPEENGQAERFNRTLLDATRAIINQSKLPAFLWGEISSTATYLLNLVSHRNLELSPYELWHSYKPSVKHLRTIGTRCFFLNPLPHKRKLDDRGIPGVLIGYGASTTFFRIWSSSDNKIYQSRKVVFEEERCPIYETDAEGPNLTILPNLYTDEEEPSLPIKDTQEQHLRRSTRKTRGNAPIILTYEELGKSNPSHQDWFNNRNQKPPIEQ